jgi:hypothetical protein
MTGINRKFMHACMAALSRLAVLKQNINKGCARVRGEDEGSSGVNKIDNMVVCVFIYTCICESFAALSPKAYLSLEPSYLRCMHLMMEYFT